MPSPPCPTCSFHAADQEPDDASPPSACHFVIDVVVVHPDRCGPNGGTRSNGPNLLIVQTDEHNFRTLGCYRKLLTDEQAFMWGPDAIVTTPHIDWLAEARSDLYQFLRNDSGLLAVSQLIRFRSLPAENSRSDKQHPDERRRRHLRGGASPSRLRHRICRQVALGRQWQTPMGPRAEDLASTDNRYMFNRGHWKQLEDTPNGPRVKARGPNRASNVRREGRR